MRELAPERRRRLIFRALPAVGVLAVLALVGRDDGRLRRPVRRPSARPRDFARAWQRGDLPAPCTRCSTSARARRYPLPAFRRAYARVGRHGHAHPRGGRASPRASATARWWCRCPSARGCSGRSAAGCWCRCATSAWTGAPSLTFPGLRRGRAPHRGAAARRCGRRSSRATARCSPRGRADGAQLAARRRWRRRSRACWAGHARRRPRRASTRAGSRATGRSGRTASSAPSRPRWPAVPGGVLLAGDRVLARAEPRQAGRSARRSTPTSRRPPWPRSPAASAASPRSTPAPARSAPSPASPSPRPSRPGSTFKIVTTTAALEARAVQAAHAVPGRDRRDRSTACELENANGEFCGGTLQGQLRPLVQLGVRAARGEDRRRAARGRRPALRLERAAHRCPARRPSTLPQAEEIRTPLEVGSTAIGQGKVLATPLRLASVAQTVASGGVRLEPSLEAGRPPVKVRVTTRRVARTLGRLMLDVVDYGTGTAAAMPGSQGGGQDRHRGARGHARAGRRRGAAAGRRLQHRRLVHGLRAGAPAADRGRRAAGARRGGRRDRGAGGPAGARAGARQVSGTRGSSAQMSSS